MNEQVAPEDPDEDEDGDDLGPDDNDGDARRVMPRSRINGPGNEDDDGE